MKPIKLILKFTILALSLVALHTTQINAQPMTRSTNFLCRQNAEFCSTETSGGHCGFRPEKIAIPATALTVPH
jgi:hypothetical protein